MHAWTDDLFDQIENSWITSNKERSSRIPRLGRGALPDRELKEENVCPSGRTETTVNFFDFSRVFT